MKVLRRAFARRHNINKFGRSASVICSIGLLLVFVETRAALATFFFEALDKQGSRRTGEIQAVGLPQATKWLQGQGYVILEVRAKRQPWHRLLWTKVALFLGWSQVGLRDLALFTRQLALLTESGIHILKSMECLGNQTWESPLLGPIARDLGDQIREGAPLSQALSAHPAVFSPIYVSLVLASERSGSFSVMLLRLADYLERDYRFRARLSAALAYPALIFVTSLGLVMFLMIYVFPKFMSFFQGMDIHMPPATQALYILTRLLSEPWVVVLGFVLVPPLCYQLRRYLRSGHGQYVRDLIVLAIPVVSSLHRHAVSARFCSGASLLMHCGLSQMQSLELLRGMVGSPVMERALIEMAINIRDHGSSFSKELFRIKYMPPYCAHLVAVGEESGKIPEILGRLATNLEDEVDLLAVQALNLLEPIILGIMGMAVAFVLWSVFVPIYMLVEVL